MAKTDAFHTCPNCGHGFEGLRKSTRMFDCPSCGTTLFREAQALNPIGNHGEMHDAPMLFGLGDTVDTGKGRYTVIGHTRFDYGRGWWDEMWAFGADGRGAWISIDEGDVVLQWPIAEGRAPQWQTAPELGSTFSLNGEGFTVTEIDEAVCVAIRGEFPERLVVGERHLFVNASGEDGTFLSGEFWEGGRAWFTGAWLDPWEIRVERAA